MNEARKRYDDKNMSTVSCKQKKEVIESFKRYATSQGLPLSRCISLCIQYCIDNNVNVGDYCKDDLI